MDKGQRLTYCQVPTGRDNDLGAMRTELFKGQRWTRGVGKACPSLGMRTEMVETVTQQHAHQIQYHCARARGGALWSCPAPTLHRLIIWLHLWAFLSMPDDPCGCPRLSRRDHDQRAMTRLLGRPIPPHTRMAPRRTAGPAMLDAGHTRARRRGARRLGVPVVSQRRQAHRLVTGAHGGAPRHAHVDRVLVLPPR